MKEENKRAPDEGSSSNSNIVPPREHNQRLNEFRLSLSQILTEAYKKDTKLYSNDFYKEAHNTMNNVNRGDSTWDRLSNLTRHMPHNSFWNRLTVEKSILDLTHNFEMLLTRYSREYLVQGDYQAIQEATRIHTNNKNQSGDVQSLKQTLVKNSQILTELQTKRTKDKEKIKALKDEKAENAELIQTLKASIENYKESEQKLKEENICLKNRITELENRLNALPFQTKEEYEKDREENNKKIEENITNKFKEDLQEKDQQIGNQNNSINTLLKDKEERDERRRNKEKNRLERSSTTSGSISQSTPPLNSSSNWHSHSFHTQSPNKTVSKPIPKPVRKKTGWFS